MGKKQQPRRKGNIKAASSERSAVLLSSSGEDIPPLSAVFRTLNVATKSKDGELDASVDSDLRLLIKKLWKKDATTRCKALREFAAAIQSRSENDVKGVLPFWPRNFNRLAVDGDRRVREATFQCHGVLCSQAGRQIAPYLRSVMATWLAGVHDSYAPAATAARSALLRAFPPEKHGNVFSFCLNDVFRQVGEAIFKLTPATVPDAADLDDNEKSAKLTRMQVGALLAAAHIVDALTKPQVSTTKEDGSDIQMRVNDCVLKLLVENKFWKLSKHSEVAVKGGFYQVLRAALVAGMIADHVPRIAVVTLGCLAEPDSSVAVTIWECSMQLLKDWPDCWRHVNLQKSFLPQLNTAIKNRAYGAAPAVFSLLLPLFSQIPDVERYRDQIFGSFREALISATGYTPISELDATALAFLQCLRYVIVHHLSVSSEVVRLFNAQVIFMLRFLLVAPEASTEGAARVRKCCFFAQLQDLLIFFEKSLEQKCNETGTIWNLIYQVMLDALTSKSYEPLEKFLLDLNSCRTSTGKTEKHCQIRKSVRFSAGSEDDAEGRILLYSNHEDNPLRKSIYFVIMYRFLSHLVQYTRKESDSVSLFVKIFSICGSSEFLKTYDSGGSTIVSEMESWLCSEDENLVRGAIKVSLQAATMCDDYDDGLAMLIQVQKHPGALLSIMSETTELITRPKAQPFLRAYFSSDEFCRACLASFEEPAKWDIIQSCLYLDFATRSSILPGCVVSQVWKKLSTMLRLAPGAESDVAASIEDLFQLCLIVETLFENFKYFWDISETSGFVECLYKASLAWHEYVASYLPGNSSESAEDVDVAGRLRDVWAGALLSGAAEDHQHPMAMKCRLSLIEDARHRILSTGPTTMNFLVQCCLELVSGDDEHMTLLKRLLPTTEDIDNFCYQQGIEDGVLSAVINRADIWLSFNEGPYVRDIESKPVACLCRALVDICEQQDATSLLDMSLIILANFIEPQPRLKAIVATLVEDPKESVKVIRNLSSRRGDYWLVVLDSFLAAIEAHKPDITWYWEDMDVRVQQVFVYFERDEEKLRKCLLATVSRVVAVEGSSFDSNDFNLISRCLHHAKDDDRNSSISSLLTSLRRARISQPELFNSSRPSTFQLSVSQFILVILKECTESLRLEKSQDTWESLLLTLVTMVTNFPWSENKSKNSRLRTALGVTLCAAVEQMTKLCTVNEDSLNSTYVPLDVRHEWIGFYNTVIAEALVPLVAMPENILREIPGVLLEAVASIYLQLEPELIREQWIKSSGGNEVSYGQMLNSLSALLLVNAMPVQQVAFALAYRVTEKAVQEHDADCDGYAEEDYEAVEDNVQISEMGIRIHQGLLDCLEDSSVSVSMLTRHCQLDDTLLECNLPVSDRAAVAGYLFTCALILQFCVRASRELRPRYLQFIEDHGSHLAKYLRTLFILLPPHLPNVSVASGFLNEHPTSLVHIACWSLFEICSFAPSVVCSWFGQLSNYKQAQRVETFVTKYISPVLIERELNRIRTGEFRLDNVTLSALATTREIQASYLLKEVGKSCEISIHMEPCHPLKPIRISDNSTQVPVSETKWRQWIRQLSAFLNFDNGSIPEGLATWKLNLDRRLDVNGEECCICFSFLHITTLKLPNYPCRTCKRKFHKACMYKWFQQGHATCPLCRTIIG